MAKSALCVELRTYRVLQLRKGTYVCIKEKQRHKQAPGMLDAVKCACGVKWRVGGCTTPSTRATRMRFEGEQRIGCARFTPIASADSP